MTSADVARVSLTVAAWLLLLVLIVASKPRGVKAECEAFLRPKRWNYYGLDVLDSLKLWTYQPAKSLTWPNGRMLDAEFIQARWEKPRADFWWHADREDWLNTWQAKRPSHSRQGRIVMMTNSVPKLTRKAGFL